MEYTPPVEDNQQLNEPDPAYGAMRGMKLNVFHSWEDAAAAEIAATLLQSPVERIKETVALILRVYGVTEQQLRERRKKLHLTIIRRE